MNRRTFLRSATAGAAFSPPAAARDEDFWRDVQDAFTLDRTVIDLNHGGVCPSPRVVQEAMVRYLQFSNQIPTHNMWHVLEPQLESVRRRLAAAFGCHPDELAITRNATEGLEICQLGIDLKRGDEVLTTDHDYPHMLDTWRQRQRREGIVLKTISFPTPPPSLDDLYQRFEQAITPRTRVILLCHMTFPTGQIFPVRRICRLARSRGIEAIVDGAHAFAHFPFTLADLDCDYYATSLHKWLLAPHGTGFLFVRRSKIAALWPLMPASDDLRADIRKFEAVGTHPAANHNAIAEALNFHQGIGAERKAARLRHLRDLWVERARTLPGAVLHTNLDPGQSCGMATMSFEGKDPGKLAQSLWDQRRIRVSPIVRDDFAGLRISPNICTTVEELNIFCEELERLVRA